MITSSKTWCLWLVLAALFCISSFSPQETYSADSHDVNNGQSVIIEEHGECRFVTNNIGATLYIPTKTLTEWSTFYTNLPTNVTAPACAGCSLDGVNLAHGENATFYQSTLSCYGTCGGISQVRTCNNGVLDGTASYSKASCPTATCASCTTTSVNWTTSTFTCNASATGGAHMVTRNLNDNAAPSIGSANFQCDDGTWVQTAGSCAGASCTLPWGGSIAHNASVTAYQTSSVPCGNTCNSQTRTCNNGTLSGSYGNQNCSVSGCSNCSLDGVTVNHNDSRLFYLSSRSCGQTCGAIDLNRTCNNGALSGSASYSKANCPAATCASCNLPWGGSIAHNTSVTAYQTSSVPCGNTCTSQSRNCNNGTLGGSYTNESCSVASCGGTWSCNADNTTLGVCSSFGGPGVMNGTACSPTGSTTSGSCDIGTACMAYGGSGCPPPGTYQEINCSCN